MPMKPYTRAQEYETDESRKPMAKAIGKNMREVRLRKKLTQALVSARANISEKYLGEIERGVKSPTAIVLQKIAVALETPFCSLLSVNGCPCSDSDLPAAVAKLFTGKEARKMKKALKMLEVFFE